ncbi:hypothetical protein QAD02_000497 [Eretmocerus hayati]|uniref:Uncharacterized protein n=1 Tax=Eretmocerus hayati TaxID=131215 RepID=A0ACC2NE67_9HYME|nr:hypothetical protein QAD02_000497 [Eretmocerus hayati]
MKYPEIHELNRILSYLDTIRKSQVNKKTNALQKFCDWLESCPLNLNPSSQRVQTFCKVYIQSGKPTKSSKNEAMQNESTHKIIRKVDELLVFINGLLNAVSDRSRLEIHYPNQ